MPLSVEQRTAKEEARQELIRQNIERAIVEITKTTLSQNNNAIRLSELTRDPAELLGPHLDTQIISEIKRAQDLNEFVVASIFGTVGRLSVPDIAQLATSTEREVWTILRSMDQEKISWYKVRLAKCFACPFSSEFLKTSSPSHVGQNLS